MIERSRVRIPEGAVEEFSSPWSTFCAEGGWGGGGGGGGGGGWRGGQKSIIKCIYIINIYYYWCSIPLI